MGISSLYLDNRQNGSADITISVLNMADGGHFSKWRPRATRPGFETSTLVIFIGKALFYQNQVRHAVLWEL